MPLCYYWCIQETTPSVTINSSSIYAYNIRALIPNELTLNGGKGAECANHTKVAPPVLPHDYHQLLLLKTHQLVKGFE